MIFVVFLLKKQPPADMSTVR